MGDRRFMVGPHDHTHRTYDNRCALELRFREIILIMPICSGEAVAFVPNQTR